MKIIIFGLLLIPMLNTFASDEPGSLTQIIRLEATQSFGSKSTPAIIRTLYSWDITSITDNIESNTSDNPNELNEQLSFLGLSAKNVVLEITEDSMMNFTKLDKSKLENYQKSGFSIALDDFGTGYSALSYLKDFHVDLIKLDKGFVHNIQPNSTEYYLSEGMTKIAKKLNIKMVAEGIETEQQFELLKEIGVDLMQGNYFSLPLNAKNFEKLMLKHADLLDLS